MKAAETGLPGVLLIEPRILSDARGRFFEAWSEQRYRAVGVPGPFVQDNVSVSRRGVVRGLHYQAPHPQGKLISVLRGAVYDVAVDVRPRSATFGRWVGVELSEGGRQLYVPEGFAHGFAALSEEVVLAYKCTDYYYPEADRVLLWNDPELGIDWPVEEPILSEKDRAGTPLAELPPEWLPRL